MSVAELKERLHEAIGSIDDTAFLEAMLTIAKSHPRNDDEPLSEEQLRDLQEREERYRNGESKPIPWAEVQSRIKQKYGL